MTPVGAAGCGACASGFVSRAPGRPRGPALRTIRSVCREPAGPPEHVAPGGKRGPRSVVEAPSRHENRRGGAPEGVRAALKRAPCRKARRTRHCASRRSASPRGSRGHPRIRAGGIAMREDERSADMTRQPQIKRRKASPPPAWICAPLDQRIETARPLRSALICKPI